MIVIEPIAVTEANLTSSVALSETEWTAGTYSIGDERRIGIELYRSVADSNTDDPVGEGEGINADPQTWIHLGKVNRFEAFDEYYHSQTTDSTDIVMTISPGEVVNSVTILNVVGASVQVAVSDGASGTLYDETQSTQDASDVVDYWEYFFSPILSKSDLTFLDLPSYSTDITVTIEASGGSAAVGAVLIGRQRSIGDAMFGTRFELLNFSVKERDDFGRFVIVPRAKAKLVTYEVAMQTTKVDYNAKYLTGIADIPCVYIGDPAREGTITYGYQREIGIPYETPTISKMSLEVESVT